MQPKISHSQGDTALQTQLLPELHLENELPGEFQMLPERVKVLIKEAKEMNCMSQRGLCRINVIFLQKTMQVKGKHSVAWCNLASSCYHHRIVAPAGSVNSSLE